MDNRTIPIAGHLAPTPVLSLLTDLPSSFVLLTDFAELVLFLDGNLRLHFKVAQTRFPFRVEHICDNLRSFRPAESPRRRYTLSQIRPEIHLVH
jgi:hypothetical protein